MEDTEGTACACRQVPPDTRVRGFLITLNLTINNFFRLILHKLIVSQHGDRLVGKIDKCIHRYQSLTTSNDIKAVIVHFSYRTDNRRSLG